MRLATLLKEEVTVPLVPPSWKVSPERLEYFTRGMLAPARLLVLDETPSGTTVHAYGESGAFGGDSWHQDVDAAKHQVELEYGDRVTEWKPIPPELTASADILSFMFSAG